jgi:hypothetical protein
VEHGWSDQSLLFMNHKPVPLGPRMFVAGLVAGLVAAWLGGCSRSDSTHVNLDKVRQALAKRRADYGEAPQIQAVVRDKAPLGQR